MKNYMQKNWIQNMRIIEKLTERKKTDYINKKLNMLPFHKELLKLDLKNSNGFWRY